ncbi:MAG: hypothetical protein ACI843_000573 [Psychrobacter glaciei]|jgi:hypothetical protein
MLIHRHLAQNNIKRWRVSSDPKRPQAENGFKH